MPSSRAKPVLILTGPPGVGKTTTAGILATREELAVHLKADTFFHFIRTGYVEPWKPESKEQNEVVMRIVAGAASGYAEAGYFTIVDGIVIPAWFLEPLRDALNGAGHPTAYAVLRAPLATCLGRVQSREGAPPIELSAIEQLWQSFADLAELERNVIDVDGRDPEEAADLLSQKLADGLLAI